MKGTDPPAGSVPFAFSVPSVVYCDTVTQYEAPLGELTIAMIEEITITLETTAAEADTILDQLASAYRSVRFTSPTDGAPILINPDRVISAKWECNR